jgi:hypothetical protein
MLDIGLSFHPVTDPCGCRKVHCQPSGNETEIATSDGTNAVTESQVGQGHEHGAVRSASRIGMPSFNPDAECRGQVLPTDPHWTYNSEKRAGIEHLEPIRHVVFISHH